MRHVFAKANVAHQDQVRHFALQSACGLLHNAVVGPGSSGNIVLLVGKTEENHRGHAQRVNFPRLFYRLVHGKVEHPRHGANRLPHTFAGTNKHGVDKRVGSEAGFAHQVAKLRGAAQTAKTGNRKGHAKTPTGWSAFQILILTEVMI